MSTLQSQNLAALPSPQMQPVPVLVLSGTLGSGKTSVINAMLQREVIPRDYDVILLENDLGRANQDFARIQLPDTQKIPLTSGCVCCRSLGQLSSEIKRIEKLPENARPDLILVETTGIAHPDVVKAELRLMGVPSVVVVTVDVAHFEENMRLNLIDRGLVAADMIVLTWWDGIVSPQALDDPRLDKVRRYIGDRELEAIALGAKRSPAQQVFFSPARTDSGGTVEAAFYGAEMNSILLPSPSDLEPLAEMSFSGGHAAIKAVTLEFRDSVTVAQLLEALAPFRETGGTLLRIKGAGFDVVHNEIDFAVMSLPLQGPVNLISSPAIDLTLVAELLAAGQENSATTAEDLALQAATNRLTYLTERHPRNSVFDGYLQTDFHEDEGYEYADRPGIPPELRTSFYAAAIEARTKSLLAVSDPAWQQHQDLPYYKWRIGSQAVWFVLNRADDLKKNGAYEIFADANPASLYFDGLRSISNSNHVPEIKPESLPWMQTVFEAFVSEIGDRVTAASMAQQAFENCRNLDTTQSWSRHWETLMSFA
ncbi:MAG: hypothetical protein J0M12_05550 [Deltaproteobacteria bacterium]|nr:hypothetical protein [Deltaproteobacteria bacterium]